MVFSATFNNNSAISWQSVSLVDAFVGDNFDTRWLCIIHLPNMPLLQTAGDVVFMFIW
jgi:hypothetical protein